MEQAVLFNFLCPILYVVKTPKAFNIKNYMIESKFSEYYIRIILTPDSERDLIYFWILSRYVSFYFSGHDHNNANEPKS